MVGGGNAESLGEFGDGEQAAGAEPFDVAGQSVASSQVQHDRGSEGLSGSGAVAGLG